MIDMTNPPIASSSPKLPADIESAKKELSKLPLLGPVAWLFARDPARRYTFFADLDWRLLPPLVLDQCKLYNKAEVPWAFVSWARVGASVDARLRSTTPLIAPHEWRSGQHLWLIDVVSPFSAAQDVARSALQEIAPGEEASVWLPDASGQSQLQALRGNG